MELLDKILFPIILFLYRIDLGEKKIANQLSHSWKKQYRERRKLYDASFDYYTRLILPTEKWKECRIHPYIIFFIASSRKFRLRYVFHEFFLRWIIFSWWAIEYRIFFYFLSELRSCLASVLYFYFRIDIFYTGNEVNKYVGQPNFHFVRSTLSSDDDASLPSLSFIDLVYLLNPIFENPLSPWSLFDIFIQISLLSRLRWRGWNNIVLNFIVLFVPEFLPSFESFVGCYQK